MLRRPNPSPQLLTQIQCEVSRRTIELAARARATPSPYPPPDVDLVEEWAGVHLQWGELLRFGQEGNGLPCLRGGWSGVEKNLVWSEGYSAQLVIPPFPAAVDSLLTVTAAAFTGQHDYQAVTLLANAAPVAAWQIGDLAPYYALLPAAPKGATKQSTHLSFQIANPCSPRMCGLSDDPRLLGLALHTIEVRPF